MHNADTSFVLTFVGVLKKSTMFKSICKCKKKNINKYNLWLLFYTYVVFELIDVHMKVVCTKHAKICNLQIMWI